MLPALLLLAALLGPEPRAAAGTVEIQYRGDPVPLDSARGDKLRSDLEELSSSCGILNPVGATPAPLDLVVEIRYASPRAFTLENLHGRQLLVSSMTFGTARQVNEGWPLLLLHGAFGHLSCHKCSGMKTLEILCTDGLESFAPKAVRENCRLAPRGR